MGKKLYVGNLSFQTNESELRDEFAKHGTVTSCDIITDRETGRSRGFAFVEFEDAASADAAQQALDGKDVDGRALRVNEAQQRERSSRPGQNRY
jgi:RNA recognition motif-containing protein